MDSILSARGWDRHRERAWSGLEMLLTAYPEGVAGVAAVDRLVEYGLTAREAMDLLDDLRASGRVVLSGGRWQLK